MFNIVRKEIEWGGSKLVLETGKIARQADGAILVSYGETVVLCTVCADKKLKEGIDFLPLTVIYQEKAYSAGKIPGGFFKREGKPSEKEVLISRLIDRAIRPLFPENYHYETQVVCTLLSHDLVHEPDVVALIGATAALQISGIPFNGPVVASNVGYIDDQFVLNPKVGMLSQSKLDLTIAGTYDSILMVESQANELTEEKMLEAVKFGHDAFKPIIKLIVELGKEINKEKMVIENNTNNELVALIHNYAKERLQDAYKEPAKQKRHELIGQVKNDTVNHLEPSGFDPFFITKIFAELEAHVVRTDIINTNRRIDGRTPEQIRQIEVEVGILPRTHGSALFTRGETQALVVTTLGTGQDEQIIDSLDGTETKESFMLHYNFPPYSVGEAFPMRAPGRREIGHGKLAWKAIKPMLPSKADFPYTLRVVSEITESNGSSSMATVCGTSLSLMEAGVPISKPVAGIAMGLILEDSKYVVLSDIMGDEDHLGDMDFKVAGTAEGVTALQMDIKVAGITFEIMKKALDQAKHGRLHILGEMGKVIKEAKSELNANAPVITKITIPKDKIRDIIGSGGKTIREICEVSKAKIDIEDTGVVSVAATNAHDKDVAIKMILAITSDLEQGQIYQGKVEKILEIGAIVSIFGTKDGLVHISEIVPERIKAVSDILKEGQQVWVKVVAIEKGKVRLSMKYINQETGEEMPRPAPAPKVES